MILRTIYVLFNQFTLLFYLRQRAAIAACQPLQDLLKYYNYTWMRHTEWTPATWSVFGRPIRTNNDIEGWHRRINGRAGSAGLGFHKLLHLLHTESVGVDLQAKLIAEEHLIREQRSRYKLHQARIFAAWDAFNAGQTSVDQLLKKIAHLHGPIISEA